MTFDELKQHNLDKLDEASEAEFKELVAIFFAAAGAKITRENDSVDLVSDS